MKWHIFLFYFLSGRLSLWKLHQWKRACDTLDLLANACDHPSLLFLTERVFIHLDRFFTYHPTRSERYFWYAIQHLAESKQRWLDGEFEAALECSNRAYDTLVQAPHSFQIPLLPHVRAWQAISHLCTPSQNFLSRGLFLAREADALGQYRQRFVKDGLLLTSTCLHIPTFEGQLEWQARQRYYQTKITHS
jgi:hypothetical protein